VSGGEQGGSDDFARARSGARAAYNLLRFGASLAYALPRDWQTRFNLSGQWTRDALIPGEQFGAGGASSVRGFNEREVADDRGYGVNAELYTPELCEKAGLDGFKCRALAFYDAAHLSRVKALPGETASSSIASIGVGMRVALDKRLSLQADVGRVTDAGGLKKNGDTKLSFALAVSY
jgi:hemolysin activation/secretion protein